MNRDRACFLYADGTVAANPYDAFAVRYVDAKRDRLQQRVGFYSKEYDETFWLEPEEVSDGRSVPWWTGVGYLLYGGRNSPGAWFHDHFYRTGKLPREKADRVFREALIAEGERRSAAAVMHGVLKGTGWYAYGQYRRKERSAVEPAELVDEPLDQSPGA